MAESTNRPSVKTVLQAMQTLHVLGILEVSGEPGDPIDPQSTVRFAAPDTDTPYFAFGAMDVLAEAGLVYVDPLTAQMYFGEPEGVPSAKRVEPRCNRSIIDEFPSRDILAVLRARVQTAGLRLTLEPIRHDLPVTGHGGRPRTVTPPDDGTVSAATFADMCGVTESNVRDWRRYGHAPEPVNVPSKSEGARYDRQEALAFAAEYTRARSNG